VNVDSILISEYASLDAAYSLTVVRTFNRIKARSLPARLPLLSVSIIIHAHPSEGGTAHHFELVLVSAKQGRVATIAQGDFHLTSPTGETPGLPIRHMMVFNAMQAEFPADGPYAFELFIDGTYHAAAAFYVGLVESE